MLERARHRPGGRIIASGSAGGSVRLWSTSSSRTQRTFKAHRGPRHRARVRRRHERLLASAGEDGQVKVWDLRSRGHRRVFRGHAGPVHALVFSADGRRLLSAGQDGVIRIWSNLAAAAEGMTLHFPARLAAGRPVAASANIAGKRVAREPPALKLGIGETAQLVVEGRGAVVVGAGRCPRAHALTDRLDPVGDRRGPLRRSVENGWANNMSSSFACRAAHAKWLSGGWHPVGDGLRLRADRRH